MQKPPAPDHVGRVLHALSRLRPAERVRALRECLKACEALLAAGGGAWTPRTIRAAIALWHPSSIVPLRPANDQRARRKAEG